MDSEQATRFLQLFTGADELNCGDAALLYLHERTCRSDLVIFQSEDSSLQTKRKLAPAGYFLKKIPVSATTQLVPEHQTVLG